MEQTVGVKHPVQADFLPLPPTEASPGRIEASSGRTEASPKDSTEASPGRIGVSPARLVFVVAFTCAVGSGLGLEIGLRVRLGLGLAFVIECIVGPERPD